MVGRQRLGALQIGAGLVSQGGFLDDGRSLRPVETFLAVARLQSQLDAHLLQLRLRRPHVEIELFRLQRGQNIARRDQ